MRLIDADELLMDDTWTWFDEWGNFTHAGKLVENAPTIDIAEVCGECKPYDPCIYCKHEFENKFERKEP